MSVATRWGRARARTRPRIARGGGGGDRVLVAHTITKLAVGGAQESLLITCAGLPADRYRQVIVTGPEVDEEGALFEEAAARGIEVALCPHMIRSPGVLPDLRTVVWLVRWYRARRPDIVHTHSSKAGFVGRFAAWVARVPILVHSVHGWSFHGEMAGWLQRAIILAERLAARVTTRLVVVGLPDREKGLAAGIGRPAQYALVRNGIDVAAFADAGRHRARVRGELGLPADAPVVGTVGRVAAQKDPLTMVDAIAALRRDVPDVRFVWVGDGPLHEAVEARVAEQGLRDAFLLAGVRRDVPEVLGALDVFALSSLWEGLPRTVTEAMAAGVPVVATAVDGVAEVVDDGESGLRVATRDPAALAAAIRRVLDDPDLAARLRQGGHDKAKLFDRPEMMRQLDEVYAGAVVEAGGRLPAPDGALAPTRLRPSEP